MSSLSEVNRLGLLFYVNVRLLNIFRYGYYVVKSEFGFMNKTNISSFIFFFVLPKSSNYLHVCTLEKYFR